MSNCDGAWVVLVYNDRGVYELDSLWESEESAQEYAADTFDDRAKVEIEWHRIED